MAGDNKYVQLRVQLRDLAKMRDQGRLTPEEYDEQVALITDGDPHPDSLSVALITDGDPHPDSLSALVVEQEVEQLAKTPSKTNEEWMVYYLKETADQAGKQTTLIESIKGWVTFFGILTVISLVLWAILIVVAIS